ncbi:MAG: hypothetical protein GY765_00395 [bacterium]|nr:hypothetical protein [bacterium]
MITERNSLFKGVMCAIFLIAFAFCVFPANGEEKPKHEHFLGGDTNHTIPPFFKVEQGKDDTVITGKFSHRISKKSILWTQIKTGLKGQMANIFGDVAKGFEWSTGISFASNKFLPSELAEVPELVQDIHFEKYKDKIEAEIKTKYAGDIEKMKRALKSIGYKQLDPIYMNSDDRKDQEFIRNKLNTTKDIEKSAFEYFVTKHKNEYTGKTLTGRKQLTPEHRKSFKKILKKFLAHITNTNVLDQRFTWTAQMGAKHTTHDYFEVSETGEIEDEQDNEVDFFAGLSGGWYLGKETLLGASVVYRSSWEPIDSDSPLPADFEIPHNWFSKTIYLDPLIRTDQYIFSFSLGCKVSKKVGIRPGAKMVFYKVQNGDDSVSVWDNHVFEAYVELYHALTKDNTWSLGIKPYYNFNSRTDKSTAYISIFFVKAFAL